MRILKRGAICIVATVWSLASWANTARAADLNAPINNQPTLGSEIARGNDAAYNCFFHSGNDPRPPSALNLSICIMNTADADRQQHTVYLPFQLGILFGGWQLEDSKLRSAESLAATNIFAQQEIPDDRYHTLQLFTVFESIEHKLKVTDEQVISAATVDLTPEARSMIPKRMKYWRTQNAAGHP